MRYDHSSTIAALKGPTTIITTVKCLLEFDDSFMNMLKSEKFIHDVWTSGNKSAIGVPGITIVGMVCITIDVILSRRMY